VKFVDREVVGDDLPCRVERVLGQQSRVVEVGSQLRRHRVLNRRKKLQRLQPRGIRPHNRSLDCVGEVRVTVGVIDCRPRRRGKVSRLPLPSGILAVYIKDDVADLRRWVRLNETLAERRLFVPDADACP